MNNNYSLKIGDGLVRSKGIFLGNHYGVDYVGENNNPSGVRIVTYNQFLDGGKLTRIKSFPGNETQRAKVIPFVKSKVGTSYDLINYNCEHFANEVQTGKRESLQVKHAIGIGLFATLALLFVLKLD